MKTRNARFEASRRLERCDRYSVACIAFLSLEIIAINIFQFVGKSDVWDRYISAATIFLSVFALVLSLIVNQAQYSLKASRYISCALSIDALCYEINRVLHSGETITQNTVANLENKYIAIRKEANLNHDQCDYRWTTKDSDEIKKAFGFTSNPIQYYWYRIKLWFSHWIFSMYFVYLIITLLGAICVICFIIHLVNSAYNIPETVISVFNVSGSSIQ